MPPSAAWLHITGYLPKEPGKKLHILAQVGSFPNWDVWGEWNGRFRDDVRRFIKGDPGCKPAFATRLAGSADLYHKNREVRRGVHGGL